MSTSTANIERAIGTIAHTELASTDPAATQRFLEKVFQWSFEKVNMLAGEYLSYETPGGSRGGIRATQPNEHPSSINYILVDDLDATVTKIKKAGGEIVLPRVDVPDMGSFLWFKVPGGPILACWQDAPNRGGKRSVD